MATKAAEIAKQLMNEDDEEEETKPLIPVPKVQTETPTQPDKTVEEQRQSPTTKPGSDTTTL